MSTPQIIPCDPISRIFAGKHHSIVIDRNERLFTFGANKFGQLEALS
jgi:alpha-tubulin suppressor-like RCC1 family protein